MPTFRDLYDRLAELTPEQLDTEIKVFPVGYTDIDSATILNYETIPQVLQIAKASQDIYHYRSGEEDWMSAGIAEFSKSEVEEMEIDKDEDYTLLAKKGQVFFKIRDGIEISESTQADLGIDTSILPL